MIDNGEAIKTASGDIESTVDGSIIGRGNQLFGATGAQQALKAGGMAMDYLSRKESQEALQKAADTNWERTQREQEERRKRVGTAPTYVHKFKGVL